MRILFLSHSPPPPLLHFASLAANHTIGDDNGSPSDQASSLYTGLNPSMAVIVIVLLSAFFLMALFTLCFRRCLMDSLSATVSNNRGQAGAALERPFRGLDKAVVDSLPLISFAHAKTKLQEGDGVTECVVCLSEFEEDEKLRLLPKCNHLFHQECIDMWLFSHTTCPLCRHSLLDEEKGSGESAEEGVEVAIPIREGARCPSNRIDLTASSRNGRQLRRSNTTGHSVVRINPLLAGQPAIQLDAFHRSRSYAAHVVPLNKAHPQKESSSSGNSSSSKGLWRVFSFRRPQVSTTPAEASSSSEATRIGGYGDEEINKGSLRRTILRLTGMDI